MPTRTSLVIASVALLLPVLGQVGCSFEPGEGTQLAGQECFDDDNCAEDLVCVERRCRPTAGETSPDAGGGDDASSPDTSPQEDTGPSEDASAEDTHPGTDAHEETCEPGETECVDRRTVRECNDDGTSYALIECPDGSICRNGECIDDQPGGCTAQGQRCDEEGYDNGYWCTDLDTTDGDLRCYGLCDRDADDPDSTCPDPNSVCAFGEESEGLCMEGCDLDTACTTDGFGCLPYDGQTFDGVCTPTNPSNRIDDSCDRSSFFDCQAGSYCIDMGQGGRCVEACRPFSFAMQDHSDCNDGHCLAVSDSLGMCRPDTTDASVGEECSGREILRTCGEDATACYPNDGFEEPTCERFCRFEEGDGDCQEDQSCVRLEDGREDIGRCE